MIDAKLVLFSRTRTSDYHWIFVDESMQEDEKSFILNDFKNKMILDLDKKYLIVRELQDKIIFYRISRTEDTDMYSRMILELQGIVFCGIDYDIVKRLFPYAVAYVFHFQLDSVWKKRLNITNATEDLLLSTNISADLIIEQYKKHNWVADTVEKIENFVSQSGSKDFIITNNDIVPIHNYESQVCAHNVQSIDDLLDNIGKQQDMQKNSETTEKRHSCWEDLYNFSRNIRRFTKGK